MRFKAVTLAPIIVCSVVITGCNSTAIDVGQLQPNLAGKPGPTCGGQADAARDVAASASIVGDPKVLADNAQKQLPSSLQNDAVVTAIVQATAKAAARAKVRVLQAKAQARGDLAVPEKVTSSVESLADRKISYDQLKEFANKFFATQLHPSIDANPAGDQSGNANAFAIYFRQYYQGKFVDRLGNKIEKPKLSMTIGDAEIAAALAVIVEFIVDQADPTPVWGYDDTFKSGTTKMYPGKTTDAPTVLLVNDKLYQKVADDGCGINETKLEIMSELASAAGDRAQLLSGLVSQSWGGFEVGLGFLGKFSLGDNQLLATIIKTTSSRLAQRLTWAATYEVLRNVNITAATGDQAQTDKVPYLLFPQYK